MRQLKTSWQIMFQAAFVVLAIAVHSAHAQEGKAPAGKKAEPGTSKYLGMTRCALCHDKCDTHDPAVTREFCLLTEGATYREEDKHAKSYEFYSQELGQRMAQKLGGIKPDDKAGTTKWLQTATQCLSCHAGWSPEMSAEPEIEGPQDIELGISCEACHGPSRDWDTPHSDPRWRKTPIDAKKDLGMTDVRDPVSRARLCYSCHIGNAEKKRVVTHEMYAAGHPPLPSIEIETFIAAMPSHARKIQEKWDFRFRKAGKDDKLDYATASKSGDAIGDLPRTKGVLVGGIVALSESLELYARQSAGGKGPEFAMFDCQACHHELRLPAWRQERPGLSGPPGRPRLPEWPAVLATIGIARVDDAKVLEDKLKALTAAMGERPFGGSEQVQALILGNGKAGTGLVDWLDAKAVELAGRPLSKNEADSAMQMLRKKAGGETLDFHSARQVAWAIRSIDAEAGLNYSDIMFEKRGEFESPTQRLKRESENFTKLQQWRDGKKFDAESKANANLGAVYEMLQLNLPAGQKNSVSNNMDALMKLISGYDPKTFRTHFQPATQSGGAR